MARYFLLFLLPFAALAAEPSFESRTRTLLDRAVETRRAVGIVAAWQEGDASGVVSAGRVSRDGAPVDGDTVFEIGSVSKVFAASLLAREVQAGRIELDRPAQEYLPAGWTLPTKGDKAITVRHLAMHTSGLPRLPAGFRPPDTSDPYAAFGPEALRESLARTTLETEPGSRSSYSNLGFMLLSHILVMRAQKASFTDLARTMFTWREGPVAQPHGAGGTPTPAWNTAPELGGVGALRMSARDLLAFTLRNARATESRDGTLAFAQAQKLAWQVARTPSGRTILWHNGGTGGSRSFVGFDRERNVAIAILTNSDFDVTRLGLHLLAPEENREPLIAATVALDPAAVLRVAGEYRGDDGKSLHLLAAGTRLLGRLGEGSPVPLDALSPNDFATGDGALRYTVKKGAIEVTDGRRAGAPEVYTLRKVAAKAAVAVAPAKLDALVGRYRTDSGREFEVARAGESIAIAVQGARVPLTPVSDTEFRMAAMSLAVVFTMEGGKPTELAWTQMGATTKAKRVSD